LVTVVALIMMLKAKMKGGKISPLLGLVTLVGFATVVWGAVTCTWFGFTPEQLPQWVKNLSIPVISNVYADTIWQLPWTKEGVGLTTAQNMQIFCFALALFQLSVAHIKGIKSNLGSLKVLGEVGALMQLWGLFYVVLMMVVNGEVFALNAIMINGTIPIGIIFVALVLVGFILSFVFSNYEGSIGQSVLESCKNIISVLLGVVNVFSDIVSYIRLWAVGLAGAAISSTVNEMAGPLLGHAILFIAAIALLVFGHGLNMILNLLSVIVHGVRLNTLEFSSHLGMSWSGFKYNPFRESGK
jgi:V/A-type H+-transporting ATPase subunit I